MVICWESTAITVFSLLRSNIIGGRYFWIPWSKTSIGNQVSIFAKFDLISNGTSLQFLWKSYLLVTKNFSGFWNLNVNLLKCGKDENRKQYDPVLNTLILVGNYISKVVSTWCSNFKVDWTPVAHALWFFQTFWWIFKLLTL